MTVSFITRYSVHVGFEEAQSVVVCTCLQALQTYQNVRAFIIVHQHWKHIKVCNKFHLIQLKIIHERADLQGRREAQYPSHTYQRAHLRMEEVVYKTLHE